MSRLALLLALTTAAACGPGGGDDTGVPCDANLLAGDLVITEIFADAEGADEGREWFEFYNATDTSIDLEGVVLIASKASGEDQVSHAMRPQIIEAGQYLVVGGVAHDLRPSHVDYGYGDELRVGSSRGLPNADGLLAIACGGTTVDEATWSAMTSGASKELDGTLTPDAQQNDDLQFWCDANGAEFENGHTGSPQAANGACSTVAPTSCNDNGTMRETVPPAVGDLIITEVMAAPDTTGNGGPGSPEGEWFEVKVLKDVDINGLQMGQAEIGTGPKGVDTTISSVDCIRVTAGSYLVFGGSTDTGVNGGVDVDYTIDFGLTNSDDGVFIGIGDNPVDVVTWTSQTTGVADSLSGDSVDATLNDMEGYWCSAVDGYGDKGQLGTPGADNPNCDIQPPDGMCFEGTTLRNIDPPTAGEIIINEWMANPCSAAVSANCSAGGGPGSAGEWIELRALGAFDLNGLELGQAEPDDQTTPGPKSVRQTITSSQCVALDTGDLVLLVRELAPAANGGIATADIDFQLGFGLTDSNDGLFIGPLATPLDVQTWASSTKGVSVQVDPGNTALTCAPATDGSREYGVGGHGTPGLVNVCAP